MNHRAQSAALFGCFGVLIASAPLIRAASSFLPLGGEYPPAGLLVGDQVYPSVGINSQGGWVVWQDNVGDGDGSGISARKLSSSYATTGNVIHVNSTTQANQENASVTMLSDGGAAVVWQGGEQGGQDIYARFLRSDGLFAGNEILLNSYTYAQQKNPEVAILSPGSQIIVVWSSFGQDGSMEGIYGQRLTSTGAKTGSEFRINETTLYNQRNPSVAALDNGGFVVSWISEQNRFDGSVDVYARTYNFAGTAAGGETLINSSTNICATPLVRGIPGAGFVVTWAERNLSNLQNHWQIMARSQTGSFRSPVRQISVDTSGDHLAPRIAGGRDALMLVWTSMGQDGSREGVFGRFLTNLGEPLGTEFQVNTYAESMQFHPSVASDGGSQFLVVWSSFVGGTTTFDLLAQRYSAAPTVPTIKLVKGSGLQLKIDYSADVGTGYQIQIASAPTGPWVDLGAMRVATGTNDSIQVDRTAGAGYYRIKVVP